MRTITTINAVVGTKNSKIIVSLGYRLEIALRRWVLKGDQYDYIRSELRY